MRNPFRRAAVPTLDEAKVRTIATRRAAAAVEAVTRRVTRSESDLAVVRVDLERIASDLRSIEERLSILDHLGTEHGSSTAGSDAPASDLLAEVRREHRQIRARFQVMSRYEERLRRVEQAVVALSGPPS